MLRDCHGPSATQAGVPKPCVGKGQPAPVGMTAKKRASGEFGLIDLGDAVALPRSLRYVGRRSKKLERRRKPAHSGRDDSKKRRRVLDRHAVRDRLSSEWQTPGMVYHAYILASASGVLYTGVTSGLERRVAQHKQGLFDGFSKEYEVTRLVYFEGFGDIRDAISREKQIKRWRREKKLALIRTMNPKFRDLSEKFPH